MTQFETTFNLFKKPWFFGLYALLVILAYYFVDIPVVVYFQKLGLRTSFALKLFTGFGRWSIYLVLFALAGCYFRFVRKNVLYEGKAWFLLGCVFLPNALGSIIKIIISRARPDLLFTDQLFGFYWFKFDDLYWSFPSGHALTIFGLISGLGVLFPRSFYPLFAFAVLVALSRVILYHHYTSDVMTGLYFGVITVGFYTAYLRRYNWSCVGAGQKVY